MGQVLGLSAGLAAGAMALLAGGPAAAQSDGYIYLRCEFQAASSGLQSEASQLKIGRGNWYSFDASTGSWGPSLCRSDFSTGYRGECSFSETRFEVIATIGSIRQTTSINRRDGSIVVRALGKSDISGACRAATPPPTKPGPS